MRAPAQPHSLALAGTGWAHPYTGIAALGTFYNDGGDPPAAVPTPADIANRPPQPSSPAPADQPEDEMVTLAQRRLNVIMRDEKEEGRRSAYRKMAEAAGLDPDTFDPTKFGEIFKQAEQARQAQLTEEQRRREDLDKREAALAEEKAKAEQALADARKQARDVQIRAALVRLGATGDDLEDAAALLRVSDDADDQAITEAADALKARRGELFGATPTAAATLPPAPGGAPAAGGPARTPATKPGNRGLEMARLRGHKRGDTAA